MSKPVLYLITSKNCGHCKNLKPKIPEIKNSVSSLVTFNEYEITSLPESFPKDLRKYVGWFPCILMANAADVAYANSNKNSNKKIRVVIFNGEFDEEKNKPKHTGGGPIDSANLTKWIKEKTPIISGSPRSIDSPVKTVENPVRTPQAPNNNLAPRLDTACQNTWHLRGKPWY